MGLVNVQTSEIVNSWMSRECHFCRDVRDFCVTADWLDVDTIGGDSEFGPAVDGAQHLSEVVPLKDSEKRNKELLIIYQIWLQYSGVFRYG